MARDGVDAVWFLPSALNVKVKEFNQAQVNWGSNYDSLQMPSHLIGDAHQEINEIPTILIYYLANLLPRTPAWKNQRVRRPCWAWL